MIKIRTETCFSFRPKSAVELRGIKNKQEDFIAYLQRVGSSHSAEINSCHKSIGCRLHSSGVVFSFPWDVGCIQGTFWPSSHSGGKFISSNRQAIAPWDQPVPFGTAHRVGCDFYCPLSEVFHLLTMFKACRLACLHNQMGQMCPVLRVLHI